MTKIRQSIPVRDFVIYGILSVLVVHALKEKRDFFGMWSSFSDSLSIS